MRKAAEMAELAQKMSAVEELTLDAAMHAVASQVSALHSYAQRWNATVLAYSSRALRRNGAGAVAVKRPTPAPMKL